MLSDDNDGPWASWRVVVAAVSEVVDYSVYSKKNNQPSSWPALRTVSTGIGLL